MSILVRGLDGSVRQQQLTSEAREHGRSVEAEVLVERQCSGLPISTAEVQIAAIFRSAAAVCATRNVRGCVDTGIGPVDPWEA